MDDNSLRDIIKEEYKKCAQDAVYFFKKYGMIQHNIRGRINFNLYKFQERTLSELMLHDYNIILKSRQMGISTLTAAYALWMMLFNSDKNILVIATKQEVAKNIVDKVRFMFDNLPSWLKIECTEDNKLSLHLSNGSKIRAESSTSDSGRSAAVSMLIIDECAFIDDIENIWGSAQQTLANGGKAIILSCVTEDTFIFTDKGLKQIKNFVPEDGNVGDYKIEKYNILGVDNIREGTYFKNAGNHDIIKLVTKFGALEGSKIHKLWAYKKSENKYNWYKLEELNIGDYISIQYGMNIFGNNDDISNFNPSKSNKIKKIIHPKLLTKEFAYLFGLYIAEGSSYKVMSRNNFLVGGNISITCGDNDIVWVFDALGLDYYCHPDGLHHSISSKNLIELFEYVGFDLSFTAKNKMIPDRLLEMSKENIIYMLKGIFDGDGCSSNGNISLTSSSLVLINQVRLLLNNLGILSSYYCYKKEKMNAYESVKNKFTGDIYKLEIYGKNALKYFNIIGFSIARKNKNKNILLKRNIGRNCSHDIIPSSLSLVKKLYEYSGENTSSIKTKFGLFLNGIVNKSKEYKTKNISRNIVNIMYNLYKFHLAKNEIEYYDKIINENIYWVKIDTISHGKKDVYDFSLPEIKDDFWCHSIIYNGFIGHQTPNGIGNFFHKTWVKAEAGENPFNTIQLHWSMHPERDQRWRDAQNELLGDRLASQECDADFWSSGKTVVSIDTLDWYRKTFVKNSPPLEKREVGQNVWVFSYPAVGRKYILCADTARGDSEELSAFHILDLETLEQCVEYRGLLDTNMYGDLLVSYATQYNDAVLVIENNGLGWAPIQRVISRGYQNLFYTTDDLKYLDPDRQFTNKLYSKEKKAVAGLTTSSITRPLMIAKLENYFYNRLPIIRGERTIAELETFIWKGNKAEHMDGYTDDLCMSLAFGLWVRDVALKFRENQMELVKANIDSIQSGKRFDGLEVSTSYITNEERTKQQWTLNILPGESFNLKELL